ncbi:Trm112 family protein [Qaidamihabitans albus]|uniref:Trm112 family protein n=1 Tax=Qaidamihabitans albus TaxID=2795733 RepID=UPI0018F26F72|nr:Trm112 family protein [Qaidamihabitans albus]
MAVTLDAQLLEILACPAPDHAPLSPGAPDDPSADALTCTSCGRVFPVRDGIPVLLLDEASEPRSSTDEPDEPASSDEPSTDGA